IISSNGLLLTNHHCGYRQIQSHSTLDDNILKNGFWAADLSQEKPNPGLTATLIQRIEDVSEDALMGVTDDMDDKTRQSQIDKNLESIRANVKKESYEDIIIRPFYNGNQYFLFVTIVYRDVRLVGTPPESIGKFGADTDNWVWPRHTGDFSLFRIYAGENNLPADYSPDNKPYQPKHHLPISLKGVKQDDFTMVFGFPGRTNQYLPKVAVEQTMNVLNPARIKIRETSLGVMDKFMRKDEASRLQYAPKFAGIANYWKKWIGESTGLESTGALAKKEAIEADFIKRANKLNKAEHAQILDQFKMLYSRY
ncbi:MAG: S46 family peptidase, partial [Bacteroidota bacterium]